MQSQLWWTVGSSALDATSVSSAEGGTIVTSSTDVTAVVISAVPAGCFLERFSLHNRTAQCSFKATIWFTTLFGLTSWWSCSWIWGIGKFNIENGVPIFIKQVSHVYFADRILARWVNLNEVCII